MKSQLTLLSALVLLAASCPGALAQLSPSEPGPADQVNDTKDSEQKKEHKPKEPKSKVPLGTRLASTATCAFLGLPVAVTKRTIAQIHAGKKDFCGESKNPILLLVGYGISLPYAAVGGVMEGVGYSAVNSWKFSGEEPFSKEAFSLGDAE